MKKTIALFMFVILSITLISGCSSEGRFNASNSNASSVSNSTSEGQYNSTTSPDTHSDITSKDNNSSTSKTQKQNPNTTRKTKPVLKNNPKLIKSEIVKKTIKKTYSEFNNKPKIEMLNVFSKFNQNNITLLATAEYKSYLEKEEEFTLKLCIENPERDTIVDVLLNDSQEGDNCLYSSSSGVFNISSIDTLWDKTAQTYHTYLTLNIPVCKSAGVRSIQVLEINFLRKIINDEINGNVDLTTKESNFELMCTKTVGSIKIENISTTSESITFSLNVSDIDKSISKINAYLYNGDQLVNKKDGITDYSKITFSSLDTASKYNIKIEYLYDKNDSKGIKTNNIEKTTTTILKGGGTESDPYQIYTIKEWKFIETIDTKDKYFKLMNDIDCNYTDISMFSYEKPFKGIFDGNNKIIKNLKITSFKNNFSSAYIGLFILNNGIIKNIKIDNININVNIKNLYTTYYGSIAAINYGQIQNCTVSGNVIINYKRSLQINKIETNNNSNNFSNLNYAFTEILPS